MRREVERSAGRTLKILGAVTAGLVALALAWTSALAQGKGGTLRIGMTASDIAYTAGIPDQGFEGYRFVGYQLYEALVRWDLSQGERLPDIAPALAESWEVDKNDVQRWVFKLRRGVKWLYRIWCGNQLCDELHPFRVHGLI